MHFSVEKMVEVCYISRVNTYRRAPHFATNIMFSLKNSIPIILIIPIIPIILIIPIIPIILIRVKIFLHSLHDCPSAHPITTSLNLCPFLICP